VTMTGVATNPSASPTSSTFTGNCSGTLTSTTGNGTYSISFPQWGMADSGTWSITAQTVPTLVSSWIATATIAGGGPGGTATFSLYSDTTLSLWWAVGTTQSTTGSGTYALSSGNFRASVSGTALDSTNTPPASPYSGSLVGTLGSATGNGTFSGICSAWGGTPTTGTWVATKQ
jgi:hypothetical protein